MVKNRYSTILWNKSRFGILNVLIKNIHLYILNSNLFTFFKPQEFCLLVI